MGNNINKTDWMKRESKATLYNDLVHAMANEARSTVYNAVLLFIYRMQKRKETSIMTRGNGNDNVKKVYDGGGG